MPPPFFHSSPQVRITPYSYQHCAELIPLSEIFMSLILHEPPTLYRESDVLHTTEQFVRHCSRHPG